MDCNLPFNVVQHKSFQALVLDGRGREHLKMPNRMTVARDIDSIYDEMHEKLKQHLKRAISRISITFDLWTDRRCRGYIGITGHYFDPDMILRAPLLAIVYVPKAQEVSLFLFCLYGLTNP